MKVYSKSGTWVDCLCPKCGKQITWLNDVPLRAYCWGTSTNEHEEVSFLVKFNESTGSWVPVDEMVDLINKAKHR